MCEWRLASTIELTLLGSIAQRDDGRGDSTLKGCDESPYIS